MSAAISTTTPISTKMTHIARFLSALILVAAAGCAVHPEQAATPAAASCPPCPVVPAVPRVEAARFDAVPFAAVPGWAANAAATSLGAFLAGCERPGIHRALGPACDAARQVPPGDEAAARRFFESAFAPHRIASADGATEGLVTGYYEPVIEGSRTRTAAYRYPVYGVPDDLIVVELAALHPELAHRRLRGRLEGRRIVPYESRAEIARKGDAFAAHVLAWVADPVELFFLQIQGSGQLRLPGGERLRLGYADQNGHPYRSLGRHLVERGELALEQASMQGIKAWAAANPAKLQDALNQNPSYVFFRESAATAGPLGALGAPLTAEYCIAVDPRHIPLGAPVYLATTWPLSTRPLQRLMLAHDTGGAIRGPIRADFYWGTGDAAGTQAGRMRQSGAMWLLWPRGEALPPR